MLSTGEPAYAVDREGVIRAWNAAAEGVFGYSHERALGCYCWELLAGRDLFGNRYCCRGCPLREAAFRHQPVNSNEMLFETAARGLQRFRVTRLLISPGADDGLLVHLCLPQKAPARDRYRDAGNRLTHVALTSREVELLELLAEGQSTADLAAYLCISPATVRNHVQHILRKLRVHNRIAAIHRARELGLI